MIRIKRVYEPVEKSDGKRFLVDRLWPRAVKKEALHITGWFKEVAPSNNLRKWFNHNPAKWDEFQKRYRVELAEKLESLQPLLEAAKSGHLTLLFSAHDTEHNNTIVLKDYLEKRMKTKKSA